VQPEEALVRACAAGDAAAWRRLVDLYAGWVLRVARATLRRHTGRADESDAEDAAAEVFRQLVERDRALLRSMRPPFNLKAWLAIVTRRAVNRQLRRRPPVGPPVDGAAPPAGEGGLDELLGRLPPADRLLLELFFVHECSYEEIAAHLGISVESVGKQKFRAIERLKALRKGEA
jgi:RNA polymerase sigma-70 factor (ECF subfamily)